MEVFGLRNVLDLFYHSNYKSMNARWENNHLGIGSNDHLRFSTFHIEHFLNLIKDKTIQEFLKFDRCFKLADKYLLSMVFVYFVRAELPFHEYTRINFFVALYLAHDLEEDDEDLKLCFVEWGLGVSRRNDFDYFISLRDKMWKAMDYRAIVNVKCCQQIMEDIQGCTLWMREREPAHGGAIRNHEMQRNYEKCSHCYLIGGSKRFYWSDYEFSQESDSDESSIDEESSSPSAKRTRSNEE